MSLRKAQCLYTNKKNSLNRLLEPIPTLLYDQSVGAEKLEEARMGAMLPGMCSLLLMID